MTPKQKENRDIIIFIIICILGCLADNIF